jgi:hypothetical protein
MVGPPRIGRSFGQVRQHARIITGEQPRFLNSGLIYR